MYSRATTSAIAERVVAGFLAPDFDLGAICGDYIDHNCGD